MIISKKRKTNGADQAARMRRLVCAVAVRKPQKTDFLLSRPNYYNIDFLKSRAQRKIPDISKKFDCLNFVSMVTAQDHGALLSSIGYRQIA